MRPHDCRWIKVWKDEGELWCRVVVRGCFQAVEKSEEDNLFASTPSLVTWRWQEIGASHWALPSCTH